MASDGKWYPADAKPGAVYDGDLNNAQPSTAPEGAVADAASTPVMATDTLLDPDVDEATAEPAEAAPFEEAVVHETFEPETSIPEPSMPDPVVQTNGGGWQSITEEPDEVVAEPDLEVAAASLQGVQDDGWTSAYEERQAGSEVLDDLPGPGEAELIDSIDMPDSPIDDFAAGAPSVDEFSAPEMPDLSAPDLAVPQVPEVDMPDMAVPEVAVPEVAAPDLAAPDVAVPDMAAPDIAAPDFETPNPVAASAAAASQPIERADAWRKPLETDTGRTDVETLPRTPGVVDLAIRDEVKEAPPEPAKRNWKMPLGILAVLGLILLIAWLIAQLFAGNTSTNTDAATTTTAPQAAETTTELEADGDADADEAAADAATGAPEVTEATPSTEAQDSGSTIQDASVFDLRAGDCIVGDIGAGQVTRVERVDCEEPHQFEVYREALIESSIETFDELAISQYAEEVCRTSLAAYIPADDDRNLRFKFLQPTEDSWNQVEDPDRVVTCLLFDGDDEPLIGRAN